MTTLRLANNFPTLFDNLFGFESETPAKHGFYTLPAVNVIEQKDSFQLQVAAPGLKKEDFKINFHNNKLTISSEKQETTATTEGKFTRKEFTYGNFTRSFVLPKTVDTDKIEASYADGILTIGLPKKEEEKAKEPKLIEIA